MSNLMDNTVNEICESMKNNPNRWEIATYTLNDKLYGLSYWLDDTTIMKTWNGRSCDVVFTYEQGKQIFSAYKAMREHKATIAQQKVIKSFNKQWWEFWK